MTGTDGERIATLEAESVQHGRRLDGQEDDLKAIRMNVEEINNRLSNWRGFMTGAAFAIATLAGLIGSAVTALWHRLTG